VLYADPEFIQNASLTPDPVGGQQGGILQCPAPHFAADQYVSAV
jgi:hypothetical protein